MDKELFFSGLGEFSRGFELGKLVLVLFWFRLEILLTMSDLMRVGGVGVIGVRGFFCFL